MLRRLSLALVVTAALAAAGCGSQATTPPHATSVGSALGWFEAINGHNRPKLLSYVAQKAKEQMGWAQPSRPWPKFNDINCKHVNVPASALPQPNDVDVRCTFQESGPNEGNPDTSWDVYLHQSHSKWLIDSYGQG
jgi:hypothetical protein